MALIVRRCFVNTQMYWRLKYMHLVFLELTLLIAHSQALVHGDTRRLLHRNVWIQHGDI